MMQLKTIGLIGGMSWESTLLYYQHIQQEVSRRCGGLTSAPMQIASLEFDAIVQKQRAGAWDELAAQLAQAARGLEQAGAECILIGTNTMHKVADEVAAAVRIPLLHIIDVTASAIQAAGCRRVAILGTRYTMEQPFYAERLRADGIDPISPDEADRAEVHRIIFDELCKGVIDAASRARLLAIIERLRARGAEGVILGCTELPMTLTPGTLDLPSFDTTRLHAQAAVAFALGDSAKAVRDPLTA